MYWRGSVRLRTATSWRIAYAPTRPKSRVGPDRAGPIGAEAAAGNGSAGSIEHRVARAAGRVVAARQREAGLLVGRLTEKADRRIAGIAFAAIGILGAALWFAGDEQAELTRAVAEAAQRCLELLHRPARIDARSLAGSGILSELDEGNVAAGDPGRVGPVGEIDGAERVVVHGADGVTLFTRVRVAEQEVDLSAVLVGPAQVGAAVGDQLRPPIVGMQLRVEAHERPEDFRQFGSRRGRREARDDDAEEQARRCSCHADTLSARCAFAAGSRDTDPRWTRSR